MPELTWELMFAFLALLFIGIIFAIMTSLGGGLQQFNIFGCEENPPAWKFWCRVSEAEEPDYLIAKQSFQALACAINAVAQGNPQLCSGYSVTQAAFPIAFAQEEKATVECKFAEKEEIKNQFEILAKNQQEAEEKCQQNCQPPKCHIQIVEKGIAIPGGPGRLPTVYKYLCIQKEKPLTCTVKNFNLSQKVSKAEEWIAGYGDPKFLVYWQNFPVGEDAAWSGYRTWLEDTFVFFLFILPGAVSYTHLTLPTTPYV